MTPRVLVVGVHIVDILGRTISHLPQGQESERIGAIRMTAAGTAAGTAVDFAKLGCEVTTHGVIGDDDLGDYLERRLVASGVTPRLTRLPDVQTSASMLAITSAGDRPVWHVPGANAHLGGEHLDLDLIDGADALHFGGVDSLVGLADDARAELLRRARSRGISVSVDLQSSNADLLRSERVRDTLAATDVFLPNLDQARTITQVHRVVDVADRLLAMGPVTVVVKLGADGCYVRTADSEFWVRAASVDVVDTTGCGDAFCAAFVTARLRGMDLRTSARVATAAGSLTATGLGSDAGLISFEATLDAIDDLSRLDEPDRVTKEDRRDDATRA